MAELVHDYVLEDLRRGDGAPPPSRAHARHGGGRPGCRCPVRRDVTGRGRWQAAERGHLRGLERPAVRRLDARPTLTSNFEAGGRATAAGTPAALARAFEPHGSRARERPPRTRRQPPRTTAATTTAMTVDWPLLTGGSSGRRTRAFQRRTPPPDGPRICASARCTARLDLNRRLYVATRLHGGDRRYSLSR